MDQRSVGAPGRPKSPAAAVRGRASALWPLPRTQSTSPAAAARTAQARARSHSHWLGRARRPPRCSASCSSSRPVRRCAVARASLVARPLPRGRAVTLARLVRRRGCLALRPPRSPRPAGCLRGLVGGAPRCRRPWSPSGGRVRNCLPEELGHGAERAQRGVHGLAVVALLGLHEGPGEGEGPSRERGETRPEGRGHVASRAGPGAEQRHVSHPAPQELPRIREALGSVAQHVELRGREHPQQQPPATVPGRVS
mmetsp:Transcript_1541/g.6120  ORF Transcript_1541/g.6120 Transcript_1541/m.6120 type:complete len:254 (-) Transcript_1541:586-1347(-)